MARGGQRTFVTVPNPLGMQGLINRSAAADEVRSLPPMTSKQAKKLAQKKNKELNKKMSKEEERRLKLEALNDAMKKDEQAKREKKAAMAKEKKLEKERKRMEERKSKGMPLVDVRPSQDRITNFWRGNKTGKKRDSNGAQLEAVQEGTPEPETMPTPGNIVVGEQDVLPQVPEKSHALPEPVPHDTQHAAPPKPFKRFRTGCTPKKEDKKARIVPRSNSHGTRSADATAPLSELNGLSRGSSPEAQPASVTFDDLDPELWDLADNKHLCVMTTHHNRAVRPRSPAQSSPAQTNMKPSTDKENEPPILAPAKAEDSPIVGCMLKASEQRKPLHGTSGNIQKEFFHVTSNQYTFADEDFGSPGQTSAKWIHWETENARSNRQSGSGRSNHYRSAMPRAMPPPPIPVRRQGRRIHSTEAHTSVSKPLRTPAPRPLLRQATRSSAKLGVATPTCTQLLDISTEDLADFLPSPSQEVRELQGDSSAPTMPPPPKPPVRKPAPPTLETKAPVFQPPPPIWKPAVPAAPPSISKAPLILPRSVPPMDLTLLLSTQDVSFSSQDIRELDETPSRPQGKHAINQLSRPAGPAVEMNMPASPRDYSVTGPDGPGMSNPELTMGQEHPAPTTGLNQDVSTTGRLQQSALTTSSQKHSALSQAARYRKRPSHSGTPQSPSSMQSSSGVTQETPCRAITTAPSRVRPVSYASRYSSGGARRQSLLSTPAARPTGITLRSTSQQSSTRSVSPAKSANLPVVDSMSVPPPAPEVQVSEARGEPPAPSVSPPKRRFLTSSNIEVMLATERSNKTFREEERKRELEERQEELARLEEERQQMEREAEGLQVAREQPHLSMVGVHIQGVEEDMAAHHDLLLEKAFSEQVYAAISQGRRHKSDVDIRVSSTQETDYGDLDVLFTTQPFRTQVFLAPRGSRAEQRGVGLGPGHASQETDYGDLDLDVAEVEKFLEQVDFSDDDYP